MKRVISFEAISFEISHPTEAYNSNIIQNRRMSSLKRQIIVFILVSVKCCQNYVRRHYEENWRNLVQGLHARKFDSNKLVCMKFKEMKVWFSDLFDYDWATALALEQNLIIEFHKSLLNLLSELCTQSGHSIIWKIAIF